MLPNLFISNYVNYDGIKIGKAVEILKVYKVLEIIPYLLQPDRRFL
jgi:hypothetical protein